LRNDHLLPKRLRRFLYIGSLGDGLRHVRADKHSHRRRPGDELAQQFQPLGPEVTGDESHAGEVSARPVEAGDEAVADRIAAGCEHDRHGGRRGFGSKRSSCVGHDHRHPAADQIGQKRRQLVIVTFRPTLLYSDVARVDETGLAQATTKGSHDVLERRRWRVA
jgi:hypothetical protein